MRDPSRTPGCRAPRRRPGSRRRRRCRRCRDRRRRPRRGARSAARRAMRRTSPGARAHRQRHRGRRPSRRPRATPRARSCTWWGGDVCRTRRLTPPVSAARVPTPTAVVAPSYPARVSPRLTSFATRPRAASGTVTRRRRAARRSSEVVRTDPRHDHEAVQAISRSASASLGAQEGGGVNDHVVVRPPEARRAPSPSLGSTSSMGFGGTTPAGSTAIESGGPAGAAHSPSSMSRESISISRTASSSDAWSDRPRPAPARGRGAGAVAGPRGAGRSDGRGHRSPRLA